MFSRLSATQKGMILVLVPVVFELVFVFVIYGILNRAGESFTRMHRSRQAMALLHKNELSFANFILIFSETDWSKDAVTALTRAMESMQTDRSWRGINLTENPELKPALEQGRKLREDFLAVYEEGIAMLQRGPRAIEDWANRAGIMTAYQIYSGQRSLARLIVDIERKATEKQPEELNRLRTALMISMCIGLFLSIGISVALVILFTKDIARRLDAIAAKAHLLAAGKVLPAKIEGSDEIAQLDEIITDAGRMLKQAREREAIVLDKAADVICSIDQNMRFASAGEACRKIWHYSPDDLLGLSFLTLLTDNSVERTREAFLRISKSRGVQDGRVENIIKCKNGERKNSIWTVRWSPEKHTYFCVVHDVSELRAVEKLKQHFLSVASHDLRAPLSAVSISVSMLLEGRKGELADGAIKELNRVQASAGRLTELVGELLELEKLEAGKLNLDLTAVSASDVCESAKELLFGLAQKNQVTLKGPSGDALILAEEKRMVQMIANLMSNAIKFSPPQSTVSISIVKVDKFAEIRISDQGPGILPEDRKLLFEKFKQTRTAEGISAKGTGLGLAIVKALAESHGGEAGVESEIGKGSTFFVRIPVFFEPGEEGL